jgi:hypothetical protein
MKIRPVGAEFFLRGQTDGHYKANTRFSQFFRNAPKNENYNHKG